MLQLVNFYTAISSKFHFFKGKSTIALLLENFYNLDSGKITIDGHDIKDLDLNWLRGSLIGFINQVNLIFNSFLHLSALLQDS